MTDDATTDDGPAFDPLPDQSLSDAIYDLAVAVHAGTLGEAEVALKLKELKDANGGSIVAMRKELATFLKGLKGKDKSKTAADEGGEKIRVGYTPIPQSNWPGPLPKGVIDWAINRTTGQPCPVFDIDHPDRHVPIAYVIACIAQRRAIFNYGGQPTRIGRVERVHSDAEIAPNYRVHVSTPIPASKHTVLEPVESVVMFAREGAEAIIAKPSPDWLTLAVAENGEGLPVLSGIIRHPILRPDLSLLSGALGYDHPTAYWVEETTPVTINPDQFASPKAAWDFLRFEWLEEFEFKGEADAARAVMHCATLMLHRTMLMAMQDRYPGLMVVAAMAGSGKTTLANVIALAVTGEGAGMLRIDEASEEELDKKLLSHARRGDVCILIDNLANDTAVNSAALDAAITSDRIEGRLLGQNTILSYPNAMHVTITGNRISTSGDGGSRFLTCTLEPATEQPQNRTFSKDIGTWTIAHRGKIISALTRILQMPDDDLLDVPDTTRFHKWFTYVGLPVISASGVRDALKDWTQTTASIPDGNQFGEFLRALWFAQKSACRPKGAEGLFGGELLLGPFAIRDELSELISLPDDVMRALAPIPDNLSMAEKADRKAAQIVAAKRGSHIVTKALAKRAGQAAAQLRLRKQDQKNEKRNMRPAFFVEPVNPNTFDETKLGHP